MNIYPFKAKSALNNEKNLADYIEHAKAIVAAGHHNFKWNDATWHFPSTAIRFTKLEQNKTLHKSANPSADQIFDTEYMSFAKSYIINSLAENPKTRPRTCFQALQYLDASMRKLKKETDITKVSVLHLEEARKLIDLTRSKVSLGGSLKKLAQTIARHNMTSNDIGSWEHLFSSKIAPDITKLPSDDAILALADIFSTGYNTEIDDECTYLTSVAALLLSAPMRISEQSWLNVDLVHEDYDSKRKKQYHIRYYSSKNNIFTHKPLVPVMASHALIAIKRLTAITEEGRKLALHLESGSTIFYPHDDCPDVPQTQPLTLLQVASALGTSKKQATELIYNMTGSYSTAGWCLESLWKVVREYNMKKNPYFPHQVNPKSFKIPPLHMSESLMCFRQCQLVPHQQTSPVVLTPINLDYFNKRLTSSKINSKGVLISSFFDRHGFNGLVMKSHQLRHFNNTASQEGNYSIQKLTEWSSRASEQVTRTYMHKDESRIAREIGDSRIPATEIHHKPITPDEYELYTKGPVITTIYGICTHQWVVSPCEKSGDCPDCSELLHCKGHRRSRDALQRDRDLIAQNLEATRQAIADGTRAATRWVQHHERRLARLDDLLAMHSDPSIPDGSPVMSKGSDYTHAGRILSTKHPEFEAKIEYNVMDDSLYSNDLLNCLKLLREQN